MKISKVISEICGWFGDWRAYIAEFFGTFMFILIASGVVLVDFLYGNIGIIGISLTVGFSYAALIFITAHLSGGYLNPAITVALWLTQRLNGVKTAFFLISQILASFLAAAVLLLIFGQEGLKYELGAPTLGINVSLSTAVLIEAVLTAFLVFVVFATMIDRRGPVSFGPFVLGLVLVAITMIAAPISGASFNPARSIGSLVFANSTNTLAVWLIGPFTGSLFGIIYELIFLKKGKR